MRHIHTLLVAITIGLMFLTSAYIGLCSLDETAANHFSKTNQRLEALESQDMTPSR